MRKITFKFIVMLLPIVSLMGQEKKVYKKKNLSVEEVNIVSSIYSQDGDNSAVTGGRGTEELMDYSNQFSVKFKFSPEKKTLNNHKLNLKLGVDFYTSASSDMVDNLMQSSASSQDTRVYPSLDYKFENNEKNYTLGSGLYYSSEFDYESKGINASISKKWNKKNTEYSASANVFIDQMYQILPLELRTNPDEDDDYPIVDRNTFSLAQSITQVIDKKSIVGLFLDVVYQDGWLGTPFNRVYFNNGSVDYEKLPRSRFKIPVGVRYNNYIMDKVKLRTFYRFYWDDWGIISNTIELELPYTIADGITLSPYFRLYQQSSSKYFRDFQTENPVMNSGLYTSDFDLSEFMSFMPGLAMKLNPKNGIINKHLYSLELKYGYYYRDNGLIAHIGTLALSFK